MDAEPTESAMTRTKRTWPAYAVLALCGAPIVGIAAWKIVHDTPVESLVIELDAEGNATITANRRWTSELRTGFRLPGGSRRLYREMALLLRERVPQIAWPVRVRAADGASAASVYEAIIVTMRSRLFDITLESDSTANSIQLSEPDWPAIAPPSAPRDVTMAGLRVPHGKGEWTLEVVQVEQAVAIDARFTLVVEEGGERVGYRGLDLADRLGRPVVVDLNVPGMGLVSMRHWTALVGAAREMKAVQLAAPEEADLSGVDGAYILTDADARAGDLVRALAFLTSRERLKVYIVWSEREGARDLWLAP